MRLVWILIIAGSGLAAREYELPAERVAHTIALKEVYLNGKGPFRMMVDTGATSCAVRPSVAKQLGTLPLYAVGHETAAGVARTPAIRAEVRVGTVSDQNVEVLVSEIGLPGVDGVLGQTWLGRYDYLLDFKGPRLVLNGTAPEAGVQVGLRSTDGRPAISVQVDGVRQDLVLDSGSSALVLFRRTMAAHRATAITNQGTIAAGVGNAMVQIGDRFRRTMAMAEIDRPLSTGLLPARAFRSVYVSNREGVVVLVPR